ncbi:unnamed protein product, partial [Effrenium voratum]
MSSSSSSSNSGENPFEKAGMIPGTPASRQALLAEDLSEQWTALAADEPDEEDVNGGRQRRLAGTSHDDTQELPNTSQRRWLRKECCRQATTSDSKHR